MCCSVVDIFTFLEAKGVQDKKIYSKFLDMVSASDIAQFKEMKLPMYCAEVHPGTGLYLPPGFQVWERIDKHCEYVGCKAVCFLSGSGQFPKDSEVLLSEIDGKLIMHAKESKVIQTAMAKLSAVV